MFGENYVGFEVDLDKFNVAKIGLVKREDVKEFIKGFLGNSNEVSILEYFVNASEYLVPKKALGSKHKIVSVSTYDTGSLVEVGFSAPGKEIAKDIIQGIIEEDYCPTVDGLTIEVDYEEVDCNIEELLEELG